MRRFFFALFLFLCSLVAAQEQDFSSYTTQDVLYNGTIYDIAQDSMGFLWFATPDGLMNFDGYNVKIYYPVEQDTISLASRRCIKLYIDSHQDLWVSTARGLCRYNALIDRFIRYRFQGYSQNVQIRDRVVEAGGRIFVRNDGKLFSKELESDSKEFQQIRIVDSNLKDYSLYIRHLAVMDNNLCLFFRTRIGVGHFITGFYRGRMINDSTFQIKGKPDAEFSGNVLAETIKDDVMYIGTDEGFYIYNLDNGRLSNIEEFQEKRINAVLEGSDGNLWLGSSNDGLFSYQLISGKITHYTHNPNRKTSILGNTIFSLYEDFSGMLFIGHGGEGLSTLNLKEKSFFTYRYNPYDNKSISDNTIMCFEEMNGSMLIGTRNNGLQKMKLSDDVRKVEFEKIEIPEKLYAEVSVEAIWDIEKVSEKEFWMGTTFGLVKVERVNGRWVFERFFGNLTIRKVYIDPHNNIWAGSYRGLFFLPAEDRENLKSIQFTANSEIPGSIPDNVITSFLLDSKNQFWIGTENGNVVRLEGDYDAIVSHVDSSKMNQFRFVNVFKKENSIGAEINEIYEMPDGTVWIATKGLGVRVYHPESNSSHFINMDQGLNAPNVFGIVRDDMGNLWMSTNKGIARYDQVGGTFRMYTKSDGIQGNIFMVNSYFKDSEGYIYFGGHNGFTRFLPEMIRDNEVLPKIYLKGISINGKDLAIGDTLDNRVILPEVLCKMNELSLQYKDRYFSINYSVIHFQHPAGNRLEYFLKGFNETPVILNAANNQMVFTNVNNGTYYLNVRASNSDDFWTDYRTILKITVLTPWYKSLLARILFVLSGLLLIYLFVHLLLNRQDLKHQLSLEQFERKNLQDLNESKLRFFTNISHEFRTPLSLILGPMDNLIDENKIKDIKVLRQLRLARRNARILLNLVNQIIDFRRLDAGRVKLQIGEYDITKLIESVLGNFQLLISQKKVEIYKNIPEEPIMLWYDQAKLERILYNLLSNALKHVPYDGSLAISINRTGLIPSLSKQEGDWVCLSIYNDGEQIPEESVGRIFERFYKVDSVKVGSGIGLAYSKSLVDLHKGVITVENTLDSGVTFDVYLREGKDYFNEAETLEIDSPPPQQEILEIIPSAGERAKEEILEKELSVLVVEDNEELRMFFKDILGKTYNYSEAEDGAEGIEKAVNNIPDIVITDLVMPNVNGIELIRDLKSREETSHIPVILLSAVNTQEEKISGYKAGADAYVVKPFELPVLLAQINRLIANRKKLQKSILLNAPAEQDMEQVISREQHFINKVNGIIEEFIHDPELNVSGLSQKLGLSATQLYRKIKAITGLATVDYIKDYRLEKAAIMLKTTPSSVKEVCYSMGFKSPSYFVKCFKKKYQKTPKEYAS